MIQLKRRISGVAWGRLTDNNKAGHNKAQDTSRTASDANDLARVDEQADANGSAKSNRYQGDKVSASCDRIYSSLTKVEIHTRQVWPLECTMKMILREEPFSDGPFVFGRCALAVILVRTAPY